MNNQNEKKQEEKKVESKMRQILIETDGNNINIVKAEVAGNLELVAVLQAVLAKIMQK